MARTLSRILVALAHVLIVVARRLRPPMPAPPVPAVLAETSLDLPTTPLPPLEAAPTVLVMRALSEADAPTVMIR